jgi:hypothetical protein
MKEHKFGAIIFGNTNKLLIGTLPPESATSYFSNHANSRLWDILFAIYNGKNEVGYGARLLSWELKLKILEKLRLGICDIISKYERIDESSVSDHDIRPHEYFKLISLIEKSQIDAFLFVYKNAAKWFKHSLESDTPVPVQKLKFKIEDEQFELINHLHKQIRCISLPQPTSRGNVKGQTLNRKLEIYRKYILN